MLEQLVGQHLMIGIPGDSLTEEGLRIFQETHAAGLIVFRPNFKSATQFKKLIEILEKKLGRKLILAVDHEGGRVIHLREGITVFPDNWTLGNTGKEAYARQQGELEAKELRRLGLDVNLAPTIDVLTPSFSPNIGIRSYGMNAAVVSRFGRARIEAMQKHGLSACAKHFPGLGASPLDPHLDLPMLSATLKELETVHLKPFEAAIRAGVDSVMSTHVVFPKIDASKMPATFSKKIITGILRQKMKFRGVIFSDDLEMGALNKICSIGEAAVRAVEAGHDMVLACHNRQAPHEIYQALLKAYQTGRLSETNLQETVKRLDHLRLKNRVRFAAGAPKAEKAGMVLSRKIASEGITTRKANRMFKSGKNIAFIFPKLSQLADRIHIEDSMLHESLYLKRLQKEFRLPVKKNLIYGIQPDQSSIQNADLLCRESDAVIYFCFDAHLFPHHRAILNRVRKAKNAIVVLMRDPYDDAFVSKEMTVLQIYGFRDVQVRAAMEKIKKLL